jgi:quinol monooxygenase YgiN
MTGMGDGASGADDATRFVATYIEVAPPNADQAATLLGRERDASRADDGCLAFEMLRRKDRWNQFVALSAWRNDGVLEAHRGTAHVADLTRVLGPLLVAPVDSREHCLFAGGAMSALFNDSLAVVTHVDVVPPSKDDAVAALTQLANAGKHHAGVLHFTIWQQTNRPNHFTVVEVWTSPRTFEAHVLASETIAFRRTIAPTLGALYDKRLFELLR